MMDNEFSMFGELASNYDFDQYQMDDNLVPSISMVDINVDNHQHNHHDHYLSAEAYSKYTWEKGAGCGEIITGGNSGMLESIVHQATHLANATSTNDDHGVPAAVMYNGLVVGDHHQDDSYISSCTAWYDQHHGHALTAATTNYKTTVATTPTTTAASTDCLVPSSNDFTYDSKNDYGAGDHEPSLLITTTIDQQQHDNNYNDNDNSCYVIPSICNMKKLIVEDDDVACVYNHTKPFIDQGGQGKQDSQEVNDARNKVHNRIAGKPLSSTPSPTTKKRIRRTTSAVHHKQSERKRRDRISQKLEALQQLVPNSSKRDKASMIDQAINYLKKLQTQVQVMSSAAMMMATMPMPHYYYMQRQQQQYYCMNMELQQQYQMCMTPAAHHQMPSMGMGSLDSVLHPDEYTHTNANWGLIHPSIALASASSTSVNPYV